MKNTIVIGAGVTGLKTACNLATVGKPTIIIEKRNHVGGLGASFAHDGLKLDLGPHKLYSTIPGTMDKLKNLLGKDCLVLEKKNSIRLFNTYFSFPPKIFQFLCRVPKLFAIKASASFIIARIKSCFLNKKIASFEDYFLHHFGKVLYNAVFLPIANKVWGPPPSLSAELGVKRIPIGNFTQFAKSFIIKDDQKISAKQFYYPHKGIGQLCDILQADFLNKGGKIFTGAVIENIALTGNRVEAATFRDNNNNLHHLPVDHIISTIHLADLLKLIKPAPNPIVLDAVSKLKFRSLILCYLVINKPKVLEDHWVFFPESDFIFSRIAELKNFSNHLYPKNRTVMTAEIPCEFQSSLYHLSDEEIKTRVLADLQKAGIRVEDAIKEVLIVKINRMYPVYDIDYNKNLKVVLDYIDTIENLYSIGRQGLFLYTNMDHSIDMADTVTPQIISDKTKAAWRSARERFKEYKIVD